MSAFILSVETFVLLIPVHRSHVSMELKIYDWISELIFIFYRKKEIQE